MLKGIIKKINENKSFTKEENHYLFQMLKKADTDEEIKEIKELIVQGNIGLAINVLKKVTYPIYLKEDLFQESIIALMEAVETYDVGKKVTFSTYASKAIQNHLLDCKLNYAHFVHIPLSVYRNAKKRKNEKKYQKMIEHLKPLYIEELQPGNFMTNFDMDEYLIREEEIMKLKRKIELLPKEDQALLFDRYLKDNLTYEKIAEKHQKSLSYVHRRIKKLYEILKIWMEEDSDDKRDDY